MLDISKAKNFLKNDIMLDISKAYRAIPVDSQTYKEYDILIPDSKWSNVYLQFPARLKLPQGS